VARRVSVIVFIGHTQSLKTGKPNKVTIFGSKQPNVVFCILLAHYEECEDTN